MQKTPNTPATVSYLEYRIVLPNIHEIVDAVAGSIAGMSFASQWEQFGTMSREDTAEYIKKAILTMYPVGRVGTIVPFVTVDIPQGMLPCDGSVYNVIDYPALGAVIDPVFFVSASEFATPDLTGKFLFGEDFSRPIGTTGGEETHTLTELEMPSHTHEDIPHTHSEVSSVSTLINGGIEAPATASVPTPSITGASNVTLLNAGGGQAHNNMPPFITVKYGIIFQ